MYDDIVEDIMEDLKEMVENNKMSDSKCNNFVANDDWEDEFSHNDIDEMQEEFIKQAQAYLIDKCKGKYIIYSDWCVHICSVALFNDIFKDSHGRRIIC